MNNDWDLLDAYAHRRDEAAFQELVRRHVDVVYGAAKRMLGGPGQEAEDVAQAVFLLLAQKAGGIRRNGALVGWLFRVTRYCCANVRKSEGRRRRQEKEVAVTDATTERLQEDLRPVLDEALGGLSEKERQAILVRYLEEKTVRETGEVLGISEAAVEKRVERGVAKLRGYFAKCGYAVPAGAAVAVLSAEVRAAPAGLTERVRIRAAHGTAVATIAKGAIVMMTWTRWKGVAAALAGAVVIVSVGWLGMSHSPKRREMASTAPPAPATAAAPSIAKGFVYMMGVPRSGVYAMLDSPSLHTMKGFLVAGGKNVDEGGLLVRLIRREGIAKELIRDIHLDDSLVNGEWKMEILPSDVLIVMGRDQAAEKGAEDREVAIVPASGDPKGNFYYIQGAVQRGGVYTLMPGSVTLSQAIVAATVLGDVEELRVKVIRREAADRESHFEMNVSDLLAGRVSDRYLQASDLVIVSKEAVVPRDEVSMGRTP